MKKYIKGHSNQKHQNIKLYKPQQKCRLGIVSNIKFWGVGSATTLFVASVVMFAIHEKYLLFFSMKNKYHFFFKGKLSGFTAEKILCIARAYLRNVTH